ncbi:O-antigen translocase [Flavivirga sp. 57AJ16]|uniref:O-antigen translocase n=1 Tax=Flavivirga sp. 57AJ16 TaxID=3025307 RepID=UPI0023660C5E|nr:O-antigen translocase [Flavivirga sp. 57AJ16]MDD7885341.1 O-antigen translocase [Flavivirga sp. 57AJ16]
MKDLKSILQSNLLLKITSLNVIVISIRLTVSLVIQRVLSTTVGEIGIAQIGQLRNLIQILMSTASLGIFNGVIKYVSEFRDDNQRLKDLFKTTFTFVFIGSIVTSLTVFFYASWITIELFGSLEFVNIIKLLALLPLVIGINRAFQGILNGLSDYKKYAKIDLLSYILSATILLVCLYFYKLEGVLFSIVITPIIQLVIILYIFGSTLKKLIKVKDLAFKIPFAKELLAFALMSFVSTALLNYIELDIRTMITKKIHINEAGYWTAMSFISKNYMTFSSGLFSLYVVPKFARIYSKHAFIYEVFYIYKTLLPLFGIGMLVVYTLREQIIAIIYPNFAGLEPLFKWQLLGDFISLATLVVAHQFLAKKMVKSFIITELISLGLFYFLSKNFIVLYGAEGVVIAHFIRSIIILVIVCFLVARSFDNQSKIS